MVMTYIYDAGSLPKHLITFISKNQFISRESQKMFWDISRIQEPSVMFVFRAGRSTMPLDVH